MFALLLVAWTVPSLAGGGYFSLGNGFLAKQMAGATTALTGDTFAGSSNPAKWLAAGDRVDIDAEFFMFHRRVKREGSGTVHDISSNSAKNIFVIPEGGFSRRLSARAAWGVTVYGNGGLNTEYRDDTGVPGSNAAPAVCGDRPANFLLGCGKVGVDITQLVAAPGLAYQVFPGHTFGAAARFAVQRFEAYGLQAFAPISKSPTDLTNRGWDWALGIGARFGWLGEITPWLTLGAAYATRVHMDEFEKYDGLIADGALDLPANYSVGVAVRPAPAWTLTFDYQRIEYGDVPATGNGVLNSLRDPRGSALGTSTGSGFNWRNQSNFRLGVAHRVSPVLVVRAGYLYGERPQRDDGLNSVTFNMLAPNPEHSVSAGLTWQARGSGEFHLTYSRWIAPSYTGPSATVLLGVGGRETVTAHVDAVMVGWSWRR